MSNLEQRIRTALADEADLWSYPLEQPLSSPRQPRTLPGWMTAGATAAVVLVVVAGTVWAVRLGPMTESRLEPPAISSIAPIEVGPFEQVAGKNGELGIEPLSEEPDRDGDILATAIIHEVAAGSQGVVAVGILNGTGGGIGAIWYSPDGRQWQRVPHDDALFGVPGEVPNTMILDVAANDAGFLAVGVHFTEPREQIVWSSPDGLTWNRTEVTGLVAAAVVATDSGWTVVGGGGLQGGVWNSTDGLSWEVATSAAFTSDTHHISLRDVAYDGERFVAVGGSSAREFREERPVVWVSDDGVDWERIEDETGVFDIPAAGDIDSVAVGPSGFVAVGEERIAEGDNPAFGVVWVSADGLEWERVRLGDEGTGRPMSITASQAGYVVLGFYSADDAIYSTRLWTSTDGLSWDVVDPDGLDPHFPGAALLLDRRLLLFGSLRRDTGDAYDNTGLGAGAVWEAGV